MPEFSQAQVEATIKREQQPFITALGDGLSLAVHDRRALAEADWRIWMPWTVSVLSDRERTHGVDTRERMVASLPDRARPLLGEGVACKGAEYFDFQRGVLASRITELYQNNAPPARKRFDKVSTACAKFLTVMGAVNNFTSPEWLRYVPMVPQTKIIPDKMGRVSISFPAVPAPPYPFESSVKSVVTYGPGLTGSLFAAELAGRTEEVHFISGGLGALFINKWTASQLRVAAAGISLMRASGQLAQMSPGVSPEQVRIPEAHYYSKGIAEAMGSLAAKTAGAGRPVDIVVMSAVHSAGAEECLAGTVGASRILRQGGLLVVKAPRKSLGGEGGMDLVAPRAMELLGSPVAAGEAGTLNQYVDASLPEKRAADYAIFQKG